VTESSLAAALAIGCQPDDPLSSALVTAPVCPAHSTGAEALRILDTLKADALVVADDAGRLLGVLLPSDLIQRRQVSIRPPSVGGMATPFGVYLTTGRIGAGVSHWALMTTGMSMFAMLLLGQVAATSVGNVLCAHGLSDQAAEITVVVLTVVFFLAIMRLVPLSGIHAAEHKVVHAIERGEELTRESVRRMPRVHPRCGTNLAVGAMLFLGISDWLDSVHSFGVPQLKLLAVLGTLALWRPIGGLVQYWSTTKPPGDRQLDMGIRSGKALLQKYQESSEGPPSIWQRIFYSGILQVMTGALVCCLIVIAISQVVSIPGLEVR
jgi:hypothetical protein